ncbi:unnamed protein product [Brugia pahangi]|uniref:E3 ubiquitin-protein ligase n=1 Tax=Brugia pahangi TaxID=6280 RepID=A0A0N4TG84_BRUPA|nr:unnamed protein product [Brugia pahangi]
MAKLDISTENDHSISTDNTDNSLLRSRRIKRQELPCLLCPNVQFLMDFYCAHFRYLFAGARLAGRKKRSVENICPCCRLVHFYIFFFFPKIYPKIISQ